MAEPTLPACSWELGPGAHLHTWLSTLSEQAHILILYQALQMVLVVLPSKVG